MTAQGLIALDYMRTVSHYKLILNTACESVEKEVNDHLEQHGYELYGSPFGCGTCYGQALVKYKYKHPASTEMPTTLQS
jgi:hypothetical protein